MIKVIMLMECWMINQKIYLCNKSERGKSVREREGLECHFLF